MYRKILVPLDGSELAESVLPHVETIIAGCGVEEIMFGGLPTKPELFTLIEEEILSEFQ